MSDEVSPEILAVHRDLVENVRVAREKLHLLEEIFPQLQGQTPVAEHVTLISQRPSSAVAAPRTPPDAPESPPAAPLPDVNLLEAESDPEPEPLTMSRHRKLPPSMGKYGPMSESVAYRTRDYLTAHPGAWVSTETILPVALDEGWRANKTAAQLRSVISSALSTAYRKQHIPLERRNWTGDQLGRLTPRYEYKASDESTMGAASPTGDEVVDSTAAYYGWIEFLLECSTVREANPHWRDGKLVWNTLQKHRPILGDAFAKQFPSFYNWMDSGLTKDQFQEGLSWIESRWDATEYKEAK